MPFQRQTISLAPRTKAMRPDETGMYFDLATKLLQTGGQAAGMIPGMAVPGALANVAGQFAGGFSPLAHGIPPQFQTRRQKSRAVMRLLGDKPKRDDDDEDDETFMGF